MSQTMSYLNLLVLSLSVYTVTVFIGLPAEGTVVVLILDSLAIITSYIYCNIWALGNWAWFDSRSIWSQQWIMYNGAIPV